MIGRFYVWLTWHVLPRHLITWCAIRVMASASTGQYRAQDIDKLTAMEALHRWEQGVTVTKAKPAHD